MEIIRGKSIYNGGEVLPEIIFWHPLISHFTVRWGIENFELDRFRYSKIRYIPVARTILKSKMFYYVIKREY